MNDARLLACELSRWSGREKRCRWCDAELPKGRRRWCSDECSNAAMSNHWWNFARYAAKKRDSFRCVRCGRDDHGQDLPPRERGLTVHHRDERADGRHSQTSCCHHLDGLETLCHPCHKAEHATAKSRAAREQRAWRDAQLPLSEVA